MRPLWPLLVIIILFSAFAVWYSPPSDVPSSANTQRIVSLAPSITETLFAINAGDQLVAVTDYCDYPAAATKLPSIGGYLNTSVESIVAHQPTLVVVPQQQSLLAEQLSGLGIPTLAVSDLSVADIFSTIQALGKATQRENEATALINALQADIDRFTTQTAGLPKTKAVVVLAHYTNGEALQQIYLSGQFDIYNELLQLAGGFNAYTDTQIKVPTVSEEGLLAMNPDVIIDIFPEADDHTLSMQAVNQQWQQLSHLSAVKHDRVHIIEADYATIPGPRVFQLLPAFAQALHPEHPWPTP